MLLQEVLFLLFISTKFLPSSLQNITIGTKLNETENHTLFFVTDDLSMKNWKCHGVAVERDWIVAPYDCMSHTQPEKSLYVAFYAPGEHTRTFIPIFGYFLATFQEAELAEDFRTYFFARLLLPLPKGMPCDYVRDGNVPIGTECKICGMVDEDFFNTTFFKIPETPERKSFQKKLSLYCAPTTIVYNDKCFQQFKNDLNSSVWDKYLICTMPPKDQPEVIVTDIKGAALTCAQKVVGLLRNEWSHFDDLISQRKENKRFPIGFLRFDSFWADFQFIKDDIGSHELEDVLVTKDNKADEQKYPFIASIKHTKQHIMTAVFIHKRFLLGHYPEESINSHYVNNNELTKLSAELNKRDYNISYIETIEIFAIFVLTEEVLTSAGILLWSNIFPGGTPNETCMVVGRPNIFSATAEQKHIGESNILVFKEMSPNPHKEEDKTFQTIYHGLCFGDNSTPMICRGLLYAFYSWNFKCERNTIVWTWHRVTPFAGQILHMISTLKPDKKPKTRRSSNYTSFQKLEERFLRDMAQKIRRNLSFAISSDTFDQPKTKDINFLKNITSLKAPNITLNISNYSENDPEEMYIGSSSSEKFPHLLCTLIWFFYK